MVTTPYRVRVTIDGVVWGDVTQGDAPDYGVALPLTFGWRTPEATAGFPNQPEPATCTIQLISDDPAAVDSLDLGQPVWVQFWADANDTLTYAEFTGRVLEVTATPHPLGLHVTVQCVDYLRDLAQIIIGDTDWPGESLLDRLGRIAIEAGIGFVGPSVLWADYFVARPASPTSTLAAYTEVFEHSIDATTTGTRYILSANIDALTGQPMGTYVVRAVPQFETVSHVIPGHMVPYDLSWTRTSRHRADHVTFIAPNNTLYTFDTGTRLVAHPPITMTSLGVTNLADFILTAPGDPFGWRTDTIRVLADRDPSVTAAWFPRAVAEFSRAQEYAGLGKMIELTDMDPRWVPRGSSHPASRVGGQLASADLTIDAAGWFIDITLQNTVYLT